MQHYFEEHFFELDFYLQLGLLAYKQEIENYLMIRGFPDDSDGNVSTCNAGDPGLIPGLGRSPGEWNGYPLQYSSPENSMDRGAWWVTVHAVAKSWT